MTKTEDILDQAAKRFDHVATVERDERKMADHDVRFAINDDGCQWPEEQRNIREADIPPRPCLVINKIPEKIDVIDGEFRQLKPSIKVRAVDSKADPKVADILAGLIRHIEWDSNAESAYTTSHTSTLYAGRGAWRIDVVDDDVDPFIRSIKIRRIKNALTVWIDPQSNEADRSDANYAFVTEWLTKEEFEAQYSKAALENWPGEEQWEQWKGEAGYRVAEYWWRTKEKRTFHRVIRNGQLTTATELFSGEEPVETKSVDWPTVKWCKLTAGQILEGPHDWPSRFIPIITQWGKEVSVRGQAKTRGLVRFAKEPQRLLNYWMSTNTEQIALSPKSPYLVTPAMIGAHAAMWNQAHIRNFPYLMYELDPQAPGSGPRREPPPQLSPGIVDMLQRLELAIMSATGIYQAQLGQEGPEISGRAIQAKQRQGNIAAYTFTDSFETALTYSAKVLIDLIPKVYDTERIVRILGEDGAETALPINAVPDSPLMQQAGQVPMKLVSEPRPGITDYLNDLQVGRYDVAVSIGPSYTTQREEALNQLMELVGAAPALAPNILDLVVKNMDLPHGQELMERLKKMVPVEIRGLDEGEEPPPPPQPDPLIMIEMAKLELEKAKLGIEEFKAQTKALTDLITAESKEAGEQRAQMAMFLQQLQAQMDRQRARESEDKNLQAQMAQQGMDQDFQREQIAAAPPAGE